MPRITDKERLERIKILGVSDEEAQDILAYDKAVERGESTEFDLTPEQEKVARQYTRTGTRKVPTTYKFTQRQRKPNATKGGLIAELADFLREHSQFSIEDLEVTNKERQIAFKVGENNYELTLTQKRKK